MTCAGTIAGLVTGLALVASEPVVVGTDGPFPNYILVDEAGVITGYERDLMDEVCLRAALDCTWKLANFDQLIPGVMSGEFDVVLGGIAVNDDRRLLIDFTQSYYFTEPYEWYIGPPGTLPPDQVLTGVQSGTVHEAHLKKLGLNHQTFATEPQVLAALAAGQVDLALGPFETRPDIQAYLDQNGFDFLYSDEIPDDGVAMAVCKGNTDLLDSLNAALDAMQADGTLAVIENRWLN
jgi:ABC-type amino acid transport substrate-binding protein